MRGKPRSWRILPRVFGITPAGAGKTKSSSVKLFAHRDHPRRCGENYNTYSYRRIQRGSPPQVRGKLLLYRSSHRMPVDHPRRCGENTRARLHQPPPMGSPPQVRGKPAEKTGQVYQMGITPAGAGKTCAAAISACLSQDHPRRCGENLMNPC